MHLHDRIISQRRDAWVHTINLTDSATFFFIKVSVPSRESERCVFVCYVQWYRFCIFLRYFYWISNCFDSVVFFFSFHFMTISKSQQKQHKRIPLVEQKLCSLQEHLESSTGVLWDSCCSIFSFLTIHADYAYQAYFNKNNIKIYSETIVRNETKLNWNGFCVSNLINILSKCAHI